LDASVALCWCFPEQGTSYTDAVMKVVEEGGEVRVPFIWPLEVSNALLIAERYKRVTVRQTAAFFRYAKEWLLPPDTQALGSAFDSLLNLARRYQLSSYDAAYLELALREGLPLATLDSALRSAARRVGVELLAASR
jgi:predicted nucleic acid-binding protein